MAATALLVAGVWLAVAAAASLTVSVVWPAVRRVVGAGHPVDRGRLLLALATTPLMLPSLVVALVLTPGLLGVVLPALDHCSLHPAHAHLCLVHPSRMLSGSVSALLATLCGGVLLAALHCLRRAWRDARRLRALSRLTTGESASRVGLVDVERPFALTFGLCRPMALISTGLLERLTPAEAAAVLAHETAHVRRRDPLRQLLARLATVAVWPRFRRELLGALALGAEQVCDDDAARATGDPLLVAGAILAVERMAGGECGAEPLATAGIASGPVAARVEALVTERAARASLAPVRIAALVALLGFALAARPLHHEVEHAIAWLLGSR